MSRFHSINPFYAARTRDRINSVVLPQSMPIEKVVIGSATLYRADCFDLLPELHDIDAVITDPP
jgi:hypothetical protein